MFLVGVAEGGDVVGGSTEMEVDQLFMNVLV